METVVLTESMKWNCWHWNKDKLVYGDHGSDEAYRINQTDGILEFSGIVTMDLTVLLEQLNYWNWTVTTDLLETMELMELIELKQLMELTELLESWKLDMHLTELILADGASGISGMKGRN